MHHVHNRPQKFLSSAKWIQSIPSNPIYLQSDLILCCYLCVGILNSLFPSGFSNQKYAFQILKTMNILKQIPWLTTMNTKENHGFLKFTVGKVTIFGIHIFLILYKEGKLEITDVHISQDSILSTAYVYKTYTVTFFFIQFNKLSYKYCFKLI
jgi:hypothetical protein